MDNKDCLRRCNIVFRSIYGNKEKIIDIIFSDPYALDIWAMFCHTLCHDQRISVDYIKMFWKIVRIEKKSLCDGCNAGILNQLGHMDRNGCLAMDDQDDPATIDRINRELLEKYNF